MASVLDLIGNTPLVEVTRIDCSPCRLFLKLESANPSGSLKDRPARAMIEAAEADGRLKQGGTIVEATAGNTGLGLALVGGRKGYRTLLVVPDKMAREKILHAQAMGAEVVITRSDVGKGHPDYYQDRAEALAQARRQGRDLHQSVRQPGQPEGARNDDRARNPAPDGGRGGRRGGRRRLRRDAHRDRARHAQRTSPKTAAMILADPAGYLILAPYVKTGKMTFGVCGSLGGRGDWGGFHPAQCRTLDLQLSKTPICGSRSGKLAASRELLRAEGILAPAPRRSGTLLAAALRYCRAQAAPKRVVTLVCDSGAKYLSKVFNPTFLAQEGWTHPDRHGTVRDVVVNRVSEGTAIVVRPQDNLRAVFARLRSTGVSQLPVVDESGHVVPGWSTRAIVLAVLLTEPGGANKVFERPVKDVMVTRVETISANAPIADLVPLFRKDYIAIVMDRGEFLGVATRLDLINYFRITT